jgi:biotin carboxyl carrier protein
MGTGSAPQAAPTATLHAAGAGAVELKSPQAGTVSVAAPVGTQVNAGDVVVRLAATPHTEAKVAEIDYDLQKRYPAEIKRNTELAEQAKKVGNQALAKQLEDKIAEREKRVTERTAERAKYEGEISKLEIKAPTAGTVKKAVVRGAVVAANDVVATLDQGGGLTADLTIPGNALKPGDGVKVASVKAPDQQADCKVAAVDGAKVTVACPADNGWADGTEIQLAK